MQYYDNFERVYLLISFELTTHMVEMSDDKKMK